MVGLAASVTGIECATPLEAEVRELRLIAEHKPRYNRRSRFPEKVHFVKLTREPWPRLSLVRGCSTTRPTTSARSPRGRPPRSAWPRCTRPSRSGSAPTGSPRAVARACVLAEMGRCLAPCDGSVDATTYAAVVRQLRDTLLRRPDEVVDAINLRMAALAGRRALRGGRGPPRPAVRVRPGGRPHPAPQRADPVRRGGGRRGARTTAAGPCTWSGSGGWPPPASSRPAPTPTSTSSSCARRPRPSRPPRAGAGGDRRGDREGPALAGVPGHPPGRGRRRVDLPGGRRDPAPRAARRGQPVPPVAGAVRRAPRPRAGPPAGPLQR